MLESTDADADVDDDADQIRPLAHRQDRTPNKPYYGLAMTAALCHDLRSLAKDC